jgi:hypothetical protein
MYCARIGSGMEHGVNNSLAVEIVEVVGSRGRRSEVRGQKNSGQGADILTSMGKISSQLSRSKAQRGGWYELLEKRI